jgi:hypothetical protein
MNPLQAIRKRRRRLVSQVLGGLAVVWLGMVLQPCLMAAEMAMDGHCPHCPAPTAEGCDGAVSNGCRYIDRVDYDGRSAYSKLAKKTLDHSPALFAALALEHVQPANACATGPPYGAARYLPSPPINVLYCVYLN